MSSTTELAAILNILEAIPFDQIKRPAQPVKQFIIEAETLFGWCQQDRSALESVGLDWSIVEDLPTRTGALREAESDWFNDRYDHEHAEAEWNKKSPDGYKLRDAMLRDMRFAFRDDPTLIKRVSEIADGTGHSDMVQDLNDLAKFGRSHLEPLLDIRFNPEKLDQANILSDELGELLGLMLGDRMKNDSVKILRDRAYTHLKAAVDKIREYGQYVFWDQPERHIGYTSAYHRRKTSSTPSTPQVETSEA